MQGVMGFLISVNYKFTRESSSEKKFLNQLRFDRIMVMNLWPPFFGPYLYKLRILNYLLMVLVFAWSQGTLEDYLELFLQFGYVFLFSAIFPTAAFWALVNNMIEIRTDAFKLCRTLRRPFAQPTASIGVWLVTFLCYPVIF